MDEGVDEISMKHLIENVLDFISGKGFHLTNENNVALGHSAWFMEKANASQINFYWY